MGIDEPGCSNLSQLLFVALLHVFEVNTRDIEHFYAA